MTYFDAQFLRNLAIHRNLIMHSFTTFSLITSLLSLVASQSIDPTSVPISTRNTWCTNQEASCPLICLQIPGAAGTPEANTCDPTDLTYSCVCSNGIQPNASEYSQTIPYFECTTYNTQCVNACPQGDTACQTACQTNNPCGAQNPVRINATTTSTTMMTSTTAGSMATGSGLTTEFPTGLGGSPPTASSTAGSSGATAVVLGYGQAYGLVMVFAGLFAGFSLFLWGARTLGQRSPFFERQTYTSSHTSPISAVYDADVLLNYLLWYNDRKTGCEAFKIGKSRTSWGYHTPTLNAPDFKNGWRGKWLVIAA